ncbi:MAG TPA: hypothetical protein VFP91_10420 [Vicinamibacterales bacterium]|nr:hypothetical protein [Vicinamibacterales bacterium]
MRVAMSAAMVVLSATIASAAQTPGSACSLLTKEDAAAALGEAVTGPKSAGAPGGPQSCEYSGSGINRVHLNIIPFTAAQATVYKSLCAQKGKEGLTGLGDVTCWYNDKHGELQVAKGTTFFSIELRRNGDPTEAIKAVAKKVYDRMK